jgi:non-specific serine/threonine protein kinase
VFAGGVSLDAAEAVCPPATSSTALSIVASLVEKSLLHLAAQPDETPRFRMLETIREFGLEQLATNDETEQAMERLAGWCRGLVAGSEWTFYTAVQWQLVERLETEHDNFRAVLDWAIKRGDAATAHALIDSLGRFWFLRGYLNEGRNWGERGLAMSDQSPTPERSMALAMTGLIAWGQGDYARARTLAEAGLSLAREINSDMGILSGLLAHGYVAEDEGRFADGETYLSQVLELCRAWGWTTWAGHALNGLGVIDYERGNVERAASRFEEALDSFRSIGNTYGIGFVLTNLAKVARERGDFAAAAALYAESLELRWEQGDKLSIAGTFRGLASVAASARQYERAARLWGAAEALRAAIGAPPPRHRGRSQQAVAITRAALGESAFEAAWAAGHALPVSEAVAEALAAVPNAGEPTTLLPATAKNRFGLTPKELEVLRLLPRGLTNKEIGEALFIAERTVTTHVQHILAKLDVGSRTEAAALAVDQGLV